MTKDEVYLAGKRAGIIIDRRKPLAQMVARLEAERSHRRRQDESPPEVMAGPDRPPYLRNKKTGKVWPFRTDWLSNPDLEPYYEDP